MMTKKTKKKLSLPRPRPLKRRQGADERIKEAFANVPKITNETVAEHREDILRGARKFIYPLNYRGDTVGPVERAFYRSTPHNSTI